jgi:hypothetical protein
MREGTQNLPLAPQAVSLVDVVAHPRHEIHERLGACEAIWAEHGVIDEGSEDKGDQHFRGLLVLRIGTGEEPGHIALLHEGAVDEVPADQCHGD